MNQQQRRLKTLLPDGRPAFVAIYENREMAYPYAVVFTGNVCHRQNGVPVLEVGTGEADELPPNLIQLVSRPDKPEKTEAETEGAPVKRTGPSLGEQCSLGTRVRWEDVPQYTQDQILGVYRAVWSLP